MRFRSIPAVMLFKPLSEVFFQTVLSCNSSITVRNTLLLACPNKGSMVVVVRLLVLYGETYVHAVVGICVPPSAKILFSDSCGFCPTMPKLLLPDAPPPESAVEWCASKFTVTESLACHLRLKPAEPF